VVFDPRSIPAFPTPLRRVIGHHWPWYRLPGPMPFWGLFDAVESVLARPADAVCGCAFAAPPPSGAGIAQGRRQDGYAKHKPLNAVDGSRFAQRLLQLRQCRIGKRRLAFYAALRRQGRATHLRLVARLPSCLFADAPQGPARMTPAWRCPHELRARTELSVPGPRVRLHASRRPVAAQQAHLADESRRGERPRSRYVGSGLDLPNRGLADDRVRQEGRWKE
jgi:hypothetical protein